ncbi:MAG: response regulator transcription factor [Saprospiraceae bacterium]|nr:response regulator transcription factor [Saprospiraceae bacterium]
MSEIRVLIVEDEPIIAQDLATCLKSIDFTVCGKAYSLAMAYRLLETTFPDIILLDINLNGNNEGIEIAKFIREKYKLPFVFLTSYSDRDTLNLAKLTMPAGYIVKPFDDSRLATTLEIALYNHSQEFNRSVSLLDPSVLNRKLDIPLTEREWEILQFLSQGFTNQQIASKIMSLLIPSKRTLKICFKN